MQTFKVIYAVLFILVSIFLIIGVFAGLLEGYWILICLALIAWSIYDLRKVMQERSKKGELQTMEAERKEIEERLKKEGKK
jgi:1,4-dihydroxy-2-naphthoate octaprenyltransferase